MPAEQKEGYTWAKEGAYAVTPALNPSNGEAEVAALARSRRRRRRRGRGLVDGPQRVDDVAQRHLVGLVLAHLGQVGLAARGRRELRR